MGSCSFALPLQCLPCLRLTSCFLQSTDSFRHEIFMMRITYRPVMVTGLGSLGEVLDAPDSAGPDRRNPLRSTSRERVSGQRGFELGIDWSNE
jgi:hypothetical protein